MVLHRPVELAGVSRYIPGWLATLVLASWLILLPIGLIPLNIPEYLRVSLGVLFIISTLLLPVAAHFHPVATFSIGGVECIEIYWLIPRWKTKWNRYLKQG